MPGHSGLQGNEEADLMARQGGRMGQEAVRLDRQTRES